MQQVGNKGSCAADMHQPLSDCAGRHHTNSTASSQPLQANCWCWCFCCCDCACLPPALLLVCCWSAVGCPLSLSAVCATTGGLSDMYEVKHLLGSGSAGDAWLCR